MFADIVAELVRVSGGVVESGVVVMGAGFVLAGLIWGSVRLFRLLKIMALERAYERNPD